MNIVKENQLCFELADIIAAAHNDIWRFAGKSVYFTGQSGFIGGWLWKTLFYYNQFSNLKIKMVRMWKDEAGYHNIPGEYDYVFHCAPIDYPFDEITAKEGILFTSSGSVPAGVTHNAQMKQGQEEELIRRTQNTKIARIFTLVGPLMRNNFAVSNFVQNAVHGKPIEIFGDGSAKRTYMYITDCVRWLVKIMLDGQAGGVYNVGSVEPVTIKELAYKVAGLTGAEVKFVKPDFVDAAPNYVPDVTKTMMLGVCEPMLLDKSLEKYIKFYKTNWSVM